MWRQDKLRVIRLLILGALPSPLSLFLQVQQLEQQEQSTQLSHGQQQTLQPHVQQEVLGLELKLQQEEVRFWESLLQLEHTLTPCIVLMLLVTALQ